MESITELRKICQSSRPSIFNDFLNRFYYRVSIYFTWLCLKLNLTANQVTVISVLFSILGGFLITSNNHYFTIIGFICFHIFAILDMSDGEVARYRGEGGMRGHFLDWFMHFITSLSLIAGLVIYNIEYMNNRFFLLISIIAVSVPVFDKLITSSGWTVIAWTKLRKKARGESDQEFAIDDKTDENSVFKKYFILKLIRFFALHPFMDHWIKLSLLLIAIVELIFSSLNIQFVNYKFIVLLYVGLLGPFLIYYKVKRLMAYGPLERGYNLLFTSKKKPTFPEDDFL